MITRLQGSTVIYTLPSPLESLEFLAWCPKHRLLMHLSVNLLLLLRPKQSGRRMKLLRKFCYILWYSEWGCLCWSSQGTRQATANRNRREEHGLKKWESCLWDPGSHKGQLGLSLQAVGNTEMRWAFCCAAGRLGHVTQIWRNCGFVSSVICERAYLFLMFITVAGYCCNQIAILCNGNMPACCLMVVKYCNN